MNNCTAKTAILNIRTFLLKLDILAFTVVRTANTYFKVIVYSNLVVGYFELGELGFHYGKTTISTFKMINSLKFSRKTRAFTVVRPQFLMLSC